MENIKELIKKLESLDYLDVEIKTPYQICESCEKKKEDVSLTIDPFMKDIHNECIWRFMCDKCYSQALDDI